MRSAVLEQLSACAPPPALLRLFAAQAQAKLLRIHRAFQSPRKALFSVLGAALAVLWLGNAAASVLFRDPFSREVLAHGVSGSLLLYGLWHVLKSAMQRPEDAIEWTPAEFIMVNGGPFRRAELVGYRLAGVLSAALLKSCAFMLFMWPDLRMPPVAFLGILCGLAFLDLLRMAVEIASFSVSDRTYARFRMLTFTVFGWALLMAGVHALCQPNAVEAASSPAGISLLGGVLRSLDALRATWAVRLLETPFWLFGQAVVAERWTPFTAATVLTMLTLLASAAAALVRWDAYWHDRRRQIERDAMQRRERPAEYGGASVAASGVAIAARAPSGSWALAWRQLVGAREQGVGIIAAMAAPALLSMAPLYVSSPPLITAINIVGAIVFYSFLLLPSLLKFDFRRDLDRMMLLKSLPLSSWSVAAAQIAAPVLIAMMFQGAVLLIAILARGLSPWTLLVGMLLMAPLNCLMFSAENAVYLLYPYRLNEEGVEIFLRTTLVFTAKGVVFGVAAGATIAWFLFSDRLAPLLGVSSQWLFVGGVWAGSTMTACAVFALLTWTYHRFDAAEDTPA